MSKPELKFVVVNSTTGKGLSLRLNSYDHTATPLRHALEEAGFSKGDEVIMTLVKKSTEEPGERFFCPDCRAFCHFSTSNCTAPKEEWVGHCNGPGGEGCGFTWPRTDDTKYFHTRTPKEPRT